MLYHFTGTAVQYHIDLLRRLIQQLLKFTTLYFFHKQENVNLIFIFKYNKRRV
jgi:hypothetical protein